MIEFEINDSQVYQALNQIHDHGESMPMDAIAQILVDSVHANFDAQGRPVQWADRADPEADWPILHKTGTLEESIYSDISGDEIRVNHGTDYGDYHQEGTSRMPSRSFLLIQDEDMDAIEQIVQAHFDEIM